MKRLMIIFIIILAVTSLHSYAQKEEISKTWKTFPSFSLVASSNQYEFYAKNHNSELAFNFQPKPLEFSEPSDKVINIHDRKYEKLMKTVIWIKVGLRATDVAEKVYLKRKHGDNFDDLNPFCDWLLKKGDGTFILVEALCTAGEAWLNWEIYKRNEKVGLAFGFTTMGVYATFNIRNLSWF